MPFFLLVSSFKEVFLMAKVKVAINGFGRIGRMTLRAALLHPSIDFDVVAVNDLTDTKTLAHLLKWDSTMREFPGTVEATDNAIIVNGKEIKVFSERDPQNLPWAATGVDIVLECTGFFTDADKAQAHIKAGAKKVIISAPAKGDDITIALGLNQNEYKPESHHIISNASCTTNCLGPVAKVLHDSFGIKEGLMTTIHSYTGDQRLIDAPHSDLRRARSAALSMIPTSTGAAKAIGRVLPALNGKLNGLAIRVPTPDVSLVDLTVTIDRPATEASINEAMRAAADGPMKGILQYLDEPLVSADFVGNPHSSIYDPSMTYLMGSNFVKIGAWYDNEWGYSNRLAELTNLVAERLPVTA
jgi:glyceraldehyde 3-phosphate dehydrogenase